MSSCLLEKLYNTEPSKFTNGIRSNKAEQPKATRKALRGTFFG